MVSVPDQGLNPGPSCESAESLATREQPREGF